MSEKLKPRFSDRVNDAFWRLVNGATIKQGCWEWNRYRNPLGYGKLRYNNAKALAHRVAYILFKGPIPDGIIVCHSCDNPSCINPEHLFLGTHKDNMRDCIAKGRHKGVENSPFKKGNQYARKF